MTTITGSYTNANPGPTLYALIETAALALGWTLEDTVTIGGNTHKVLKSAAAGNARAVDFFIDINFPTTGVTGGLRIAPFEGYTAASDVGLRGPFSQNVTTIDGATWSRYGTGTSALETNWTNSATYTGLSLALSTALTNYIVSITRNRIIIQLSSDPAKISYAGFFIPTAAHIAQAGAALFPLIQTVLTTNVSSQSASTAGSVSAAVTRLPKLTAFGASPLPLGWHDTVVIPNTIASMSPRVSGRPGTLSEFTNQASIVPLPVLLGAASINASSPTLAYVGDLDGVAAGWVPNTSARGDSVSDGTDTWYCTTPSTYWGMFMEAV